MKTIKVKALTVPLSEYATVSEEASVDEAVHLLVMGYHQSLLVTRDKSIVGILRLTDVFREVCNEIKACEL